MTSASQHSRRIGGGGEDFPGLGLTQARKRAQLIEAHGQGQPRDGAVALGQDLGGLQEPAGLDQGVEHPGAVVARVAAVVSAAGYLAGGGVAGRAVGGLGCGQRDQGGLDDRGVLGRAASLDPGAAGLVVGDGEVPAEVGGAFEPVEGFLVAAFVAVGVDHGDQVQGGLLQLGGVEPFGVVEEDLDAAGTQVRSPGSGRRRVR